MSTLPAGNSPYDSSSPHLVNLVLVPRAHLHAFLQALPRARPPRALTISRSVPLVYSAQIPGHAGPNILCTSYAERTLEM